MSRIYLGGAIDMAGPDSHNWFGVVSDTIVSVLKDDVVIFNPFAAFINANKSKKSRVNDQYVVSINKNALLEADIACFVWTNSPSFGVVCEILSRVGVNKPLLFINLSGKEPGIYMREYMLRYPFVSYVDNMDDFSNVLKKLCEYGEKSNAADV